MSDDFEMATRVLVLVCLSLGLFGVATGYRAEVGCEQIQWGA